MHLTAQLLNLVVHFVYTSFKNFYDSWNLTLYSNIGYQSKFNSMKLNFVSNEILQREYFKQWTSIVYIVLGSYV